MTCMECNVPTDFNWNSNGAIVKRLQIVLWTWAFLYIRMCAWIEYLNLHAMLGKGNIYYPIWWFHGDECHGTKWRNHLGVVGSTCFSRIPCHLTIYAECRSKEPCRRALFLTVSSQNNPNPKNFKIWRKNRWKYIEYSNTYGKLYECIILISTRCHKKNDPTTWAPTK